jgi:hypothetical protein
MKVQMDEGLTPYDRVRVTWEGACIVNEETSREYADFEHFGGRSSVLTSVRSKLTVENPQTVWIQSLAPDKIQERINGEFLNPDAVLLQTKLNEARAENEALVAKIADMRSNYEASQVLWKKRHRDQYWLTDADLTYIGQAIERGEPDPDPLDW